MSNLSPQWLHSLPEKDRDEVQAWIRSKGVNLDHCAYVFMRFDGRFVAKMYAIRSDGRPEVRDGEVQWDEDIAFEDNNPPQAVRNRLAGM